MHRRVWFLAAAAAGVLLLASSATAMTVSSASSNSRALAASSAAAMKWENSIPRTPAAQKAKKTMVFGLEQTVTGFNLNDADENAFYAAIVAGTPIIRGNYLIDNKGNYHLDMASKVVATKKSLKITIRKDANWWWQGHKATPVTAADYIYTWKQIVTSTNNVASNTGYANIASAKASGHGKVVTFTWRTSGCSDTAPCGAFADYRDLFGYIYPSFALKGQSFNSYWHNCVCGSDGHPISDGPFYMSKYVDGQGMTLKKNPTWYGKKSGLNEIDFKIITDTNSEIQAMKGGEVDAIAPSPESALKPLATQKNLTYSAVPSFTQEHWDLEQGPQGNPLLKKLYVRAALAEGMNRQSLIKALYGGIAPGLKPLDNTEYEFGSPATGKNAYFHQYNYNPKKAIALLKKNGCTGGPSAPSASNSKIWSCGGQKAEFRFATTSRASRVESEQIFQQQLMSIGIKIDPTIYSDTSIFFGQVLPSANFDIGEYAWVGGPDPSGFDSIYQCFNAKANLGGSNYKRYCNHKVDSLIKKADVNFNPTQRTSQYEEVAKLTSDQIAVIPLYASPQIFVYKKALKGASASNNPTSEGPTWNLEQWHW